MSHKRTLTAGQKRAIAMASVFVALYGCAGQQVTVPEPLPVVAPEQSVNIDPTLMTYCDAQPHIPRQQYSQGKTLDPVKFWQNLYTECAGKQRKLVDLAADAFKLPPPKPPVVALYPSTTP